MQADPTTVDNTVDERVSTVTDTPESELHTQADENVEGKAEEGVAPEATPDNELSTDEADHPAGDDTFPRKVVEDLRQENGRYRQRAQKAEQRLHNELVRATGRLADPSDLPFDAEHLDDDAALSAAIDTLLTRKPHLAARRPTGDIGQGVTKSTAPVNLHDILRTST